MTIETIDHVTTGVDRLTYKLQQENIEKLLTLFLEKSQEIEDAFIILANQKSIDLAEGIWLDYIGKIVGVKRNGLSDEDYRAALRFQIGINNADGTPNIIIELVKEFTNSDSVRVAESGIAFATLSLDGLDNLNSDLWKLLQDIKPAGTRWIIHSDVADNGLHFAYEDDVTSSKPFQVSNDGVNFENFEVSNDGITFDTFFTSSGMKSYYKPSLVEGKNTFYYEGAEPFQVSNDGITFEDFEVVGTGDVDTQFYVFTPYNSTDSKNTLWWEVQEDSVSATTGYEDMLLYNDVYDLLSQEYTTTVNNMVS